jgi:hypothetical protein
MRILREEEDSTIDKEKGIVEGIMISTEIRDPITVKSSMLITIERTRDMMKMVRKNRNTRREETITRAIKEEAEGDINREEAIRVIEEEREVEREEVIETDLPENMNKMKIMIWTRKERLLRKKTNTRRRKYLKRSRERMKNNLK